MSVLYLLLGQLGKTHAYFRRTWTKPTSTPTSTHHTVAISTSASTRTRAPSTAYSSITIKCRTRMIPATTVQLRK